MIWSYSTVECLKFWHSDSTRRRRAGSTLVQEMAHCLFGAKQLPEPIGPLEMRFSKISIITQKFSAKKMRLQISSAKCQPFCPGLNVCIGTSGRIGPRRGQSNSVDIRLSLTFSYTFHIGPLG